MGFNTITINSTKDTYIDELNPNSNFGSATTLLLDATSNEQKTALIGFDFTSVPQDIFITKITIELEFLTGTNEVPKYAFTKGDFVENTVTFNNYTGVRFPSTDIDGEDGLGIVISGPNTVKIAINGLPGYEPCVLALSGFSFTSQFTMKSIEGGFTPKVEITHYIPENDTYKSIQDTYIDQSNPNTSYGAASPLLTGSGKAIFLRFEEILNFQNKKIDSMKFVFAGNQNITDRNFDLNYISGTWGEFSLTYNNAPNITYAKSYIAPGYTSQNWYNVIDITSFNIDIDDLITVGFAITGSISMFDRSGTSYPFIEVSLVNLPIESPIITNPIENQYLDREEDFEVKWTTDQQQAEYELEYSTDELIWTKLTGTTAQSRIISGGTFAVGDLYFRIRYKPVGSTDFSDWSDSVFVNAVNNPTAPINITSGAVTTATPTITGTGVGVLSFTITLKDSFGNVFETATVSSTTISYTVKKPLQDGISYTIEITYKDITGFNSDLGSSTINTTFIKPNTPTITTETGSNYINVQITNPSGGNAVDYNDVYKIVRNRFERVATNIPENGLFVDRFAESGKEQIYFVRAYAASGGYAQSEDARETLTFLDAYLTTVDSSIGVELILAPERRKTITNEHTTFNFAGRKSSVVLYSGLTNENLDTFQYEVHDDKTLKTLEDMVQYKQTVCYRDARGRKLFLALTGINIKDEMPDYYTVSFNSFGVDYNEVV